MTPEPGLIAVDWGTTRFRAYLAAADGTIFERRESDDGIAAISPGGFASALLSHCGSWLDQYPGLPVVMAGMIGSRNGWIEAPYAPCPASPADIALGMACAEISPGRAASIIPGLITRESAAPDVMRGEETLIFGSGVTDGIAVLPGTHSKWARIEGGRITGFMTFMTGEFYDVLVKHSLLGRLAAAPEDSAGFRRGLEHAAGARLPLTHAVFAARTLVLAGGMPPGMVAPFLSGLLIGAEIRGAREVFGVVPRVSLIGGGALARNYEEALAHGGIAAERLDSEACLLRGIAAIGAARRAE